jgi:hypothetical protein
MDNHFLKNPYRGKKKQPCRPKIGMGQVVMVWEPPIKPGDIPGPLPVLHRENTGNLPGNSIYGNFRHIFRGFILGFTGVFSKKPVNDGTKP